MYGTNLNFKYNQLSSQLLSRMQVALAREGRFSYFILQLVIFESSIAADNKLTVLVNGLRAMALSSGSQKLVIGEEPDQKMRGYTVRFAKGRMLDQSGYQRAVIVKKFQTMDPCEDRAQDRFDCETELRRDLLDASFARMLGISIASRRTKMIVMEAVKEGTIVAYDYLQNLHELEYFLEHSRIWTIYQRIKYGRPDPSFFVNTEALGEEGKSGCACEDWEEWMASGRIQGRGRGKHSLRDGFGESDFALGKPFSIGADATAGGSWSFEEYADLFEAMRESVTNCNEEKTEKNARDLWTCLKQWSETSPREQRTETSLTVGEIGWIDGKVWHSISLRHQIPVAQPPQYLLTAARLRDGEWDTIVGTQVEEFTRWSIDVSSGEEVYLRSFVLSHGTRETTDFFYGCALSLARGSGVDVHSLRHVSQSGLVVDASLRTSNEQTSTIYYFAYPNSDGPAMVPPDPPGFWSLSPDPLCHDFHFQADAAEVQFCALNDRILPLLRDLGSYGFLPVSDSTDASNLPFASVTEVSEHATESTSRNGPRNDSFSFLNLLIHWRVGGIFPTQQATQGLFRPCTSAILYLDYYASSGLISLGVVEYQPRILTDCSHIVEQRGREAWLNQTTRTCAASEHDELKDCLSLLVRPSGFHGLPSSNSQEFQLRSTIATEMKLTQSGWPDRICGTQNLASGNVQHILSMGIYADERREVRLRTWCGLTETLKARELSMRSVLFIDERLDVDPQIFLLMTRTGFVAEICIHVYEEQSPNPNIYDFSDSCNLDDMFPKPPGFWTFSETLFPDGEGRRTDGFA
ncbi:hypothetical protein SISNIDRAFT_465556 [Sistotremastrum niveocremeum HHB9708]|uniref:Uncharacterized protein n=1 Tax=Sistotremastrum niveocremeum HHB9708 TaxID=1314777 RepID=A0A164VAC5_9AGAM|nr:hypothetical protein SISNIDRAFT_465556 [Sistotremastrum niveocremeum HHB9708]